MPSNNAKQNPTGEDMLIFNYPSKKAMKECVGQNLRYTETSIFGNEYLNDGKLTGSNRPQITRIRDSKGKLAREFFAQVTMKDGKIFKVE